MKAVFCLLDSDTLCIQDILMQISFQSRVKSDEIKMSLRETTSANS